MYKLVLNHYLQEKKLNELYITPKILSDIDGINCSSYLKMPMVKKSMIEVFCSNGFLEKMKLHHEHQLYITGIKSKVGLCIQMGHKAGFYFDLYKLAYLADQGLINQAIIILPSKNLEKFCNTSSIAAYELISKQMSLFKKINNTTTHIMCLDIKRRT